MKKLLVSTLLVTTTLASTVFAQVATGEAERRGGPRGQGENRMVIRELVSAQIDLEAALSFARPGGDLSRKLRSALMKIDNSIDMLSGSDNGGGHGNGHGDYNDKRIVVSLKSTKGVLYIGESNSRIQSIQLAQEKCIRAEWSAVCRADENNLKTEEYSIRQNKVKTCSLESTRGQVYVAQAKTSIEAVSLAQAKCISNEWAGVCQDNKVRCD